jgi:hypothetical protein
VFVGPYGATPLRGNFATIWKRAKAAAGERVPADLHFHDYADLRVMPTSASIWWSAGRSAWCRSA